MSCVVRRPQLAHIAEMACLRAPDIGLTPLTPPQASPQSGDMKCVRRNLPVMEPNHVEGLFDTRRALHRLGYRHPDRNAACYSSTVSTPLNRAVCTQEIDNEAVHE